MTAIGSHLMLRLDDDRVILKDTRERRIAAAIIHRVGRGARLLDFGAGDTHLHLMTGLALRESMQLARRVECGIKQAVGHGVGFQRARHRPIESQHHVYNLSGYLRRQAAHHGFEPDPLYEGSGAPDLVGMRVGGEEMRKNFFEQCPRARVEQIAEQTDLPFAAPQDLSHLVEEDLVDAMAGALCLPSLPLRGRDLLEARVALVKLMPGVRRGELAERLGTSRQLLARYDRLDARPDLRRAVALQIVARSMIRERRERLAALQEAAAAGHLATQP